MAPQGQDDVGDDLLEDWPAAPSASARRRSSCPEPRAVQFSESSVLFVYGPNWTYEDAKSHGRDSTRSFRHDTLHQAMRLKRTLSGSSGSAGADDDEVNKCPIEQGIQRLEALDVAKEEVLGLEQLVLEDDPRKVLKLRQLHLRAVLAEQAHQDRRGVRDVDRLGKLSALLTKRPTRQARSRAALAAA